MDFKRYTPDIVNYEHTGMSLAEKREAIDYTYGEGYVCGVYLEYLALRLLLLCRRLGGWWTGAKLYIAVGGLEGGGREKFLCNRH